MEELLEWALQNGVPGAVVLLAAWFIKWGYPSWRADDHKQKLELREYDERARQDFLTELEHNRAAMSELTKTLLALVRERSP